MKYGIRTLSSLAAMGAYAALDKLVINSASLFSAETAVTQLQNIDQPVQQTFLQLASGSHISELALFVGLGAIWYKPIKAVVKKMSSSGLAALFLALGIALTSPATSAHAYYNTRDYPEYVEILPNQTAFAIPEQGANLKTQAAFMSEQYLAENKVAMKRFQVPHTLIRNPGWTSDYYVPATKLLVVDRTPYMREWVNASDRGTSTKKEGFDLETKDSVNIDVGVVISATVSEENAAKFVYHFGSRNTSSSKSNDPETTFASVLEARSLSEVMDQNVRGMVQRGLAREFGGRSFDKCLEEKAAIMEVVEKEVTEAFARKGITIEYIGYATALGLSPKIQDAIDAVVVANRKAAESAALASAIPVLQAQADIKVDLLRSSLTKA